MDTISPKRSSSMRGGGVTFQPKNLEGKDNSEISFYNVRKWLGVPSSFRSIRQYRGPAKLKLLPTSEVK